MYGNFKNKEELFLELIAAYWRPIIAHLRPGANMREQMRIFGKTMAAEAKACRHHAAAATAFQLYTLTHKEMRAELTQRNAAIYKKMTGELLKIIPAAELPMPAGKLVSVLDALITGLLFTYFQTPDLITEDIFITAFEALV